LQNNQTVAELDSVELDSYEMAFKGAGDSWNYSASAYFMDKENDIITNSARENLNNAHTKHRGIELAVGFDVTETLSVNSVFNMALHTYENSEFSGGIDVNGNRVDTAPTTFGNLRLTWRPTTALLAELEWVNMGDYYTNPENTASYDGHDLANLRVQYQYSEDINLSLNVLNITDVQYAERADWTTFTGDRYFPGEPARAFFAVNWNFN
jgi:outer membrane receptor protein involved in Fe transport